MNLLEYNTKSFFRVSVFSVWFIRFWMNIICLYIIKTWNDKQKKTQQETKNWRKKIDQNTSKSVRKRRNKQTNYKKKRKIFLKKRKNNIFFCSNLCCRTCNFFVWSVNWNSNFSSKHKNYLLSLNGRRMKEKYIRADELHWEIRKRKKENIVVYENSRVGVQLRLADALSVCVIRLFFFFSFKFVFSFDWS